MDERSTSTNYHPTRRFLIGIIALVAVAVIASMAAAYLRTQELVDTSALSNARSYTGLIVATRLWNSSYGGVWVVKGPGVTTNPFLRQLGISADAATTDGRDFTMRSPSIMTQEIGKFLVRSDGTYFHLTSLRPINPENAPDQWERSQLVAFAGGATEGWADADVSGVPTLRYMRALITNPTCVECHAQQGYKVGDVQGAISVNEPLAASAAQSALNAALVGGFGIVATAMFLGITLALLRRMRGQLDLAQAALVEAATVDVLTGVASRRQTMQDFQTEVERAVRTGDPTAVIMIDIDLFKDVNDTRGHAAGDSVLAEIAHRIAETLRPYDIFGRIGGEEFLIVAPATGIEEAVAIAERARSAVSSAGTLTMDGPVFVTISLGVTLLVANEPDAFDRALARADQALYDAKESGRNRVSVSIPES